MVTIHVNQRHIDEGESNDCELCAVGLAMSEAFPDYLCRVLFTALEIGDYRYETPEDVFWFMLQYDDDIDRKQCEPFSFTLPDHDLNGKPTSENLKHAPTNSTTDRAVRGSGLAGVSRV